MALSRTAALSLAGLGLLGVGLAARARWPSSESALACPPESVRWADAGRYLVAACGRGTERPPPAQVLALGMKLDLNAATEEDLAQIHGVGKVLARALVEARAERHGFRTWDDVDAVKGVGPEKLRLLQETTDLRH